MNLSPDKKTTILGLILAGLIASNVDYTLVMQLDPQECGKLTGALVTYLLAYYTNKQPRKDF